MGFVVKAIKKVGKAVMGPVLGLITGGGSGFIQGLGNLATAVFGGPIAVAMSVGSALLAKKPKAPDIPRESIDRLQSNIDPRTPRKFVFGDTAMANDIRDYEYSNNQEYLHQFIVVAAHKVAGINQIWMNEKLAWTATGGAQGEYAGYLTVATRLEGASGNAINIGARMGGTRRYTGCAYVHIRYKLTGNGKKAESPFAGSVPTKMVIRGRGALVYDPRLDSTVPGGSGPHRHDNQNTWTWNQSAARNPALQMLWYLLGWKINGKLSVGCGIPADRIDMQSFITAANLCDETVTLAAGGTEPRYRSDGVGSTGIGPITMLDNLKAAMNADLDDVDGKLRLTVFHNDLADPVADFGDDDMIAGFTWNQTPDLSDMFNVVRGTYVDASPTALYQMVDYPEVRLPSRDAIDRLDSFDLAFVQSPSQAQRLAKQRLQRQQYGGTFETVFNARGWLIEKNSVARLSCSVLGWTNKLFRVAEMEHRIDGTCPVILREENASIYAWDASEVPPVTPAEPTAYDYTLDPFYQGLEQAGEGTNVIWIKSLTPPITPLPSAGVPAGWFEKSADLPADDIPIWISYGKRAGAVFEWQSPILSSTDTRYWDAIDQDGAIKSDKVDGDAIIDEGVDTPNIDFTAVSRPVYFDRTTDFPVNSLYVIGTIATVTLAGVLAGSRIVVNTTLPISLGRDVGLLVKIMRSVNGGLDSELYSVTIREPVGAALSSDTVIPLFYSYPSAPAGDHLYKLTVQRLNYADSSTQTIKPFSLLVKEEKR